MDIHGRLVAAREKLEAKDVAGALGIYDEVLAAHGDEGGVLATISGDLGSTGHIDELLASVAPLYDPERHGPAAGLNLLQAYIAKGDVSAARHVLDLLIALNRPELEERLWGFSGAIAQMAGQRRGNLTEPPARAFGQSLAPTAAVARAHLVSITKPIWFYGLEPLSTEILPPKEGRLRRIAFAQISLAGVYEDAAQAGREREDEFGRLARALPLWLAEAFYFSPAYAPLAAIAMVKEADGASFPLLFDDEWTADNLRQLVDTTAGGLDYILTGVLSPEGGACRLLIRVWEVKNLRERKQFTAHWTPATADSALTALQREICRFMECAPHSSVEGIACAPPSSPRAWLDVLAASAGLFLAGKNIFPKEVLAPLEPLCAAFAPSVADSPVASLAWLTLLARARSLGLAPAVGDPKFADHPIVERAKALLLGAR